ncbi:MAG: transporter substrate-binding domain-containing protein [Treponema sp.]|nr:transporter substrate-binding domain-containing protein [Treponema sp.]
MPKSINLKIILHIFIAFTLIVLSSCENLTSSYRSVEKIQKSGVIRIAVYTDKKPFSYIDENGNYQGYDIYLANRIAKDLGVEVEYVPVISSSRIEALNSGKADLLLASFTRTISRISLVDFALPYMKVSIGVLSREGDLYYNMKQLSGKTIIVNKGTTAESFFEINYPNTKLIKYDSYQEAFSAFENGEGDAISEDGIELLAWSLEHVGYKLTMDSINSQEAIAPAVQKGNSTLLSWLNAEIKYLAFEQFFHKDFEATLRPIFGSAANADTIVVEGGLF